MYRILYAEKADEDLTEIYNYIAVDSPARAAAYLGKMESCILQLKDFPNIGYSGKYPELVKLGIRMLPFEDYLVFYTVSQAEMCVHVLRVLHGSVNYRRLFRAAKQADESTEDGK